MVLERKIPGLRFFCVTEVNYGKKVHFCNNVLGKLLSNRRMCCRRWYSGAVSSRIQDEDICIQLSCAKTTLTSCLIPFFPCCKSMLVSRLLERSVAGNASPRLVNILPTAGTLGALSAAPASLGQELEHTVIHHLIVRAYVGGLTSTISLQESFNSNYCKNIDKFLSLLQSTNCRYIFRLFDPGYKTHHCPLYLPSSFPTIWKHLPREDKKTFSCCRST